MASFGNVYLAFCVIATGGLLYGYIIGINGNIVTKGQLMCKDGYTGPVGTWTSFGYGQCYHLDVWDQGILSSLNLIGATASSIICFRYADTLGRKREVQIGAGFYLLGSIVAGTLPVLWAIYSGFFLYGLGIGFAMHAAPVYIAEISPPQIRGSLVAAKEGLIVVGMFLGFAMGAIFHEMHGGWHCMMIPSALLAMLMQIGMLFIPNSPCWLVLRSVRTGGLLGAHNAAMDEAKDALHFFHAGDKSTDIEAKLMAMRDETRLAISEQSSSAFECFNYPKPLIIGCGLVFLQQVTGQPSVLYFATNIFKDAGFGSDAALSSVSIGAAKLLSTLFAVCCVDRYGRRQLLFLGIFMMTIALSLLSAAFRHRTCQDMLIVAMQDCPADEIGLPYNWALVTVGSLMIYVSGYQVGFGPISWLMISEIFPLGVRGSALSTAAIINFGTNILVTMFQSALMKALSPAGLFSLYLVMAVLSLAFVARIVPETKGRTLEDIEREITGRKECQEERDA
eukprot:TRINITY_DN9834_c0_g1_i1.p1 TRINITY_DN9834_c0_g1~~TRINITY_DN9834_c0_g1_i1.p1  ORF type:complete len:508 (-),score=80.50 TRINITY_DN9834_c0_g1_i1:289-1812(-)